MSAISDRAQELVCALAGMFVRNTQIVARLNDAQSRVHAANLRLWSQLHPDALALPSDEQADLAIAADSRISSDVNASVTEQLRRGADEHQLEAGVLAVVQEINWTIHRAFVDYQSAGEERRQLAIEVGELAQRLTDALTATGWPETEARNETSTSSPKGEATMSHTDHDPLAETVPGVHDRAQRFNLWIGQLRSIDPAYAEAARLEIPWL
jgi:hypothetical protein